MSRSPAAPALDFARLALFLDALANPARLQLLHVLREPRIVSEIGLRPSDAAPLNPERNISQQAVRKHLAKLEDAGLLVARRSRRGGMLVEERIVNHQMLYAITEQLRDVTRLTPTIAVDPMATLTAGRAPFDDATPGPRLVVVHGALEGTAFGLEAAGRGRGPCRIGRREGLAVSLDYDPYVSLEHAEVAEEAGRFVVRDLPRSKNGTRLNWRPLPRGGAAPLVTGDVIGVGRTSLLFRGA